MSDIAAPFRAASTGQWWVQVKGQAYGPYTKAQLQDFVSEGRVRPNTLVSDQKDGAWVEARRVIGLVPPAQTQSPANDGAPEAANVFVHAEIFGGSWNAFMAALESMGVVCDIGPGLWLLRTGRSVSAIRNALSQTLERGDRFVVIDATRDRLAWFNLGPEVDVKIGHVWNKPIPVGAR